MIIVLLALAFSGAAAGKSIVYVGMGVLGGEECWGVTDSFTIDWDADECPKKSSSGGGQVVVLKDEFGVIHVIRFVVGAEYGSVKECWVITTGFPHPCDFPGVVDELLDRADHDVFPALA